MKKPNISVQIMLAAVAFGLIFWIIDGIVNYYYFHDLLRLMIFEKPTSVLDTIVFSISPYAVFVRFSFLVACTIGGALATVYVTEQKKAKEESRSLAKFTSENPNPVLRIAEDGAILHVNKAAQALMTKHQCEKNPRVLNRLRSSVVSSLNSGLSEQIEAQCGGQTFSFTVTPIAESDYANIYGVDITDQKDTEKRFRNTLDNMMEGCQIIDYGWRYIYVNNAVVRHGHLTKKELIGKTMMEAYPGIEKTPLFLVLSRCMKERVSEHMENEFLYANGTKAWFELSIQPVPEGIFILSIDSTERKKAEEKLIHSQERYRTVFENTGTAMCILEEDKTISMANRELQELLGYSEEELTKKKWTEFVTREHLERMEKYHDVRRKDGETAPRQYTFDLIARNGQIRNVMLVIEMIPRTKKSVASIIDITDRKKMEDELRESEEKYRTLAENLRIGIYRSSGLTGKFVAVNPALTKILGYENENELLSKNFTDFHLNPEEHKKFIAKLTDYGAVLGKEVQLKRNDGTPFWASVSVVAIPDEKGEIPYYDGTIEDITERKILEMQLNEYTERLQFLVEERTKDLKAREATLKKQNIRLKRLDGMKSRFISTVTHELRTPLVSIKGYTEFIRSGGAGKVPTKIDDMLTVVERNADRLSNLTDDLLDIQRIESGRLEINPEPLKIQTVIEEVVQECKPFIYKKNQILKVDVPDDLPTVYADRIRISQVIVNFLTNAAKFTQSGGTISIEAQSKDKMMEVQVSDNGIGMAKKDLKKLFKLFPDIQKPSFYGGSGRGLSICKGIIELHGGKIWAESEGKNRGATFAFTIPVRGETK